MAQIPGIGFFPDRGKYGKTPIGQKNGSFPTYARRASGNKYAFTIGKCCIGILCFHAFFLQVTR
jgi:hypothetical protein